MSGPRIRIVYSHIHMPRAPYLQHGPAAAVLANTTAAASIAPSPSPSALSHLLARAGFRWLLVDAWEAHWLW